MLTGRQYNNLAGNVDQTGNTTKFFIIEEAEETILVLIAKNSALI